MQFPPLLCNQISQEELIFEKGRYASRQQNEDFELFEPLQFLLIIKRDVTVEICVCILIWRGERDKNI